MALIKHSKKIGFSVFLIIYLLIIFNSPSTHSISMFACDFFEYSFAPDRILMCGANGFKTTIHEYDFEVPALNIFLSDEVEYKDVIYARVSGECVFTAMPGGEEVIENLADGSIVSVLDSENIFYSCVEIMSGKIGYIRSSCLVLVSGSGAVSDLSVFDSYFSEKITQLRELLPDGMYWNHNGEEMPVGKQSPLSVTHDSCVHSLDYGSGCNLYNGAVHEIFPEYEFLMQCLGFASFVSDYIFTEGASLYVHESFDDIKAGDHVRIEWYDHSFIVLEKGEDFVTVVEVNRSYEDCLIEWDNGLTKDELTEMGPFKVISRYPFIENL